MIGKIILMSVCMVLGLLVSMFSQALGYIDNSILYGVGTTLVSYFYFIYKLGW